MKDIKYSILSLFAGLLLITLSTDAEAQSQRDAVESYNSALELVENGDFEQAINTIEEALIQAEEALEAGEDAEDTVEQIKGRIPQIYFQKAAADYERFQQDQSVEYVDSAIEGFEDAIEKAEEHESEQIAQKADNVITQLYYRKAAFLYGEEELEDALEAADRAIERNENYAQAYYQKGLIVNKMSEDNLDEFLDLMDQAAEIASSSDNSDVEERATERAAEELVYRGSEQSEDDNFNEAIEFIERGLEYNDESANAYYRLAEAYNGLEEWDTALEHANRGLELESGGNNSKAKYYFEMGVAYKNKDMQSDACSAFENAAYGSFQSPAEHELEYELECEGWTD